MFVKELKAFLFINLFYGVQSGCCSTFPEIIRKREMSRVEGCYLMKCVINATMQRYSSSILSLTQSLEGGAVLNTPKDFLEDGELLVAWP
jgi:hypothetical protein